MPLSKGSTAGRIIFSFSDLEMTGDAEPGAIVEARAYEDANGRKRLSLAIRSDLTLQQQITAPGATWFDRQLLAREPVGTGAAVSGPRCGRRWTVASNISPAKGSPAGRGSGSSLRVICSIPCEGEN